jgi:4-hydroxy-4-methyl-2-oxoglutarate aldolase
MTKEERLKVFSEVETGCVTDAMVQLGVGRWMKDIFPTKPDQVVFGPAVPVQFDIITDPDKIIDQFQIVEMCRPHDVLVWNVPSDANIIGENIVHFIRNSGLGGIIIDGCARDVNTIGTMDLPAFFRGRAIAPAPRNMRSTKELFNISVACGGTVVNPGDYVFGDNDGVLVVPEKDIDRVLRQAKLNMEYEKRMEAALDRNCTVEDLVEVQRSKQLITD